jgi:hypothetical protein
MVIGTDKLQLMANVQEPSPPRTPSRKPASIESSPVSRFHDVEWRREVEWNDDAKRRRIDSGWDMRPPMSTTPTYPDSRRPSMIDPALERRDPLPERYSSFAPPQHRPSYSYAPPLPAYATPHSHARHQSTPAPYGHGNHSAHQQHESQPHGPPSRVGSPVFGRHQVPPQSGHYGEHRPSYYSDPPPSAPVHSEYRPHEPYYGHSSNSGYPPPPHDPYSHSNFHAAPQPSSYNYVNYHAGIGGDQLSRKRRGNLPKEATQLLKDWFYSHRESPYPTEDEKIDLCRKTGLNMNQVRQTQFSCTCEQFLPPSISTCLVFQCHSTPFNCPTHQRSSKTPLHTPQSTTQGS